MGLLESAFNDEANQWVSIRGYGLIGIKRKVWITLPTKYCVKDITNMMQQCDLKLQIYRREVSICMLRVDQ